MKLFKIYTEDKNREQIEEILSIGFDGFTVIRAKGFYEGASENALVIEIYTDNAELVRALASTIRRRNKQDSVLVAAFDVDAELVTK